MIDQIASDDIIESAYEWLCKRRERLSHNNDVWGFRQNWDVNKLEIQVLLLSGEYQFSPQTELRFPDGPLEYWSARDALVLKTISFVLGEYLVGFISQDCYHVAAHGGSKKAVRDV